MNIFKLFANEADGLRKEIFVAASVSGMANAGILAIINRATEVVANEEQSIKYIFLFLAVIAIYVFCLRYTFRLTTRIFEDVVNTMRIRLSRKIAESELVILDDVGKSVIFNRLTQETASISSVKTILVSGIQSVTMVIAISAYMAYLSRAAFLLTLLLVTGGVAIYLSQQIQREEFINSSTSKEVAFVDAIDHTLDGFKEIKLNSERREEIVQEVKEISGDVNRLKIRYTDLDNEHFILAQCFFYFLLGAIVFLLPRFIKTYPEVINELTASILFIIGPLNAVVIAIPTLARVNIAIGNLYDLEDKLDEYRNKYGEEKIVDKDLFLPFEGLNLERIQFSYRDRTNGELFNVGPIDFDVKAGEILFFTGGNGCGKSTVIKLLTALYYPKAGVIRVGDTLIVKENVHSYRNLFTAVYSDFHLFKRLYGLSHVDSVEVNRLLKVMQLQEKTRFVDDHFTNIDLSTGQRKRLALIISLLEDKPIYIFDEWAAEQDPIFRKYFYRTILQELKSKGKTVIAVSHDEKYFDAADRVIRMEYGKIESIS